MVCNKLFGFLIGLALLSGCGSSGSGEIVMHGAFVEYTSTCGGTSETLTLDPPRKDTVTVVGSFSGSEPVEVALSEGCEFRGFVRNDGSFLGERAKECLPDGIGRQSILIRGLNEQEIRVIVTSKDAGGRGCENQDSGIFHRN